MSDDLVKILRADDGGWRTDQAADRIEELEAKLAKAVEALQTIKGWPEYRLPRPQDIASAALAELKGDKT